MLFALFVDEPTGADTHTHQARHLLYHDTVLFSVVYLLICITERKSLAERPDTFNPTKVSGLSLLTTFSNAHTKVLFELASAYGTVGLSLSVGRESFVSLWRNISKLFVILLMILGRQRRLPVFVDAAVNIRRAHWYRSPPPPPPSPAAEGTFSPPPTPWGSHANLGTGIARQSSIPFAEVVPRQEELAIP